jgi:uncharacterized phage protein gp47/JayE
MTALKNLIDAGSSTMLTNLDTSNNSLHIYSQDGYTPHAVTITDNLEIIKLGSPGQYKCTTKGAIVASKGLVDIVTDSISGLNSVSNLVAGTTGNTTENDTTLRVRRRTALYGNGYATDDTIYARVLEEVANVTYVKVISNRQDVVDSAGRPPHSTEVVIRGGINADIAQKLWDIWPAGTTFYGNTSYTVIDSSGDPQIVKFTRPTNVYIWIKITLTISSEELFPIDGTDQIARAIINWTTENMSVNSDVIYQQFMKSIYSVKGVTGATILVAKSADPNLEPTDYASENIPIADAEVAIFDLSRIDVSTL